MAKAPASANNVPQARASPTSPQRTGGHSGQTFGHDTDGSLNLGKAVTGLLVGLVSIILTFIGIFAGTKVVAALLPDYFTAGNSIIQAFADVNITDSSGLANTIAHLMPLLLGIVVVVGPLGFIVGMFIFDRLGSKKGGGAGFS